MKMLLVRRARSRAGFTLLEILVVIAIIAVLISLLAGGVMVAMRTGPLEATRQDIRALAAGVESFKTDKQLNFYFPSKLRLWKNITGYTTSNTSLDQHSLQFIQSIWPNIDLVNLNMNWAGYTYNAATQTYTALPFTDGIVLEGDQCLVFFLGGIVQIDSGTQVIGMMGFSTNPKDPTAKPDSVGEERKKYFQFDSKRLYSRGGSPFPSYNDAFSFSQSRVKDAPLNINKSNRNISAARPYMYFSSGKGQNGYHPNSVTIATAGTVVEKVAPYMKQTSPAKYYNPSTCQIISAGADGLFGPGGLWPPTVPAASTAFAQDDIANFTDGNPIGVQ